ncbi:hypothetical protein [Streptomyces erythrochromogenes]|uniref:hypothetical protein n=1 Tax=Streptomyces erythrochromogenes TaxID=285574 RepID=UPI0033DBEC0F
MSGVLRVRAAEGALRAAMEQGIRTPEDLAQALEDCRLLQSPETAAARAALRPVAFRPTTVPVHTTAPGIATDSPAADLALQLAMSQPDVLRTAVSSATEVRITVRPQSVSSLTWWLWRFQVAPETGVHQDGVYTARGHRQGVTVDLVVTGDVVAAWTEGEHRAP